MPSPPTSPPPPPPPPTTQSATPLPGPPSAGPHDSDQPPTPTPPQPGSPVPAEDPAPAPVAVPPSTPESESEEVDSAPAPASPEEPVLPSAPGGADSDHPEAIPRPTYKEERQPGFPFDLLGIGGYKADREPLRTCVTEVYRAQPTWRTSTKTYKELPEEERRAAEQQLQSELEKLYPATTYTTARVRACREWLPGVLLARRHKDRRNTWARRRGAA